ncbi:MAG: hydantoinase/oxoprolinase family protein [Thermoleophilia bacterium]
MQTVTSEILWAQHFMISPRIEVADDGQTATGTWFLLDLLTMTGLEEGAPPDAVLVTANYTDRYAKVDGEWKFAHVVADIKMITNLDQGWCASRAGASSRSRRREGGQRARERRGTVSHALGVDVGGTFTDVVALDETGRVTTAKAPSTPQDQSVGVLDALGLVAARLGLDRRALLEDAGYVVHGTTVPTNAMLELDGAHTGVITTRGFRDVLDVRRGFKEADFDIRLPAPRAIARRRDRIGVTERVDSAGRVLVPLAEDEVEAATRQLVAQGVTSIAVCYLFSFLHPGHELRTRELIHRVAPHLHVSLSHEVLPRVREFERLSATVVDAYVTPRLEHYLGHLSRQLAACGFGGELFIMSANGGMLPVERAARSGAQLVLSGPAGGVAAGARIAAGTNAITADMGGTSFDVCLIDGGRPIVSTDGWMSRYRIAVPTLDMKAIGAGGGSLARVDAGGRLHVGPESAGSSPGPACFGRGGTRPTVTDANLVLGLLGDSSFLGGTMALDRAAAARAIDEHVGRPLGLSTLDAAAGIFRIVNNAMANGIREVSISRGHDPRDFALIAFGGACGIHASRLARELGIRRVVVPRAASVLCALGDVLSDVLVTRTRGWYARASSADPAEVQAVLRAAAQDALAEAGSTLESAVDVQLEAFFELHYVAQTHELVAPAAIRARPRDPELLDFDADCLARTIAGFHELHERLYTFAKPESDVELLGVRVDVRVVRAKPEPTPAPPMERESGPRPAATRPVYLEEQGGAVDVPTYRGADLRPGDELYGPLVVEEPDTTIVAYPGDAVRVLPDDAYELRVGTRA